MNPAAVLTWLRRRGSRRNIEGMARFGIISPKAFGVSMATMRPLVKRLGRDHDLAAALWSSGWHEARILASFIDEPARVTPAQMDRWARDFNNWAVCDSVCLHLFTRTPHAWKKVAQWSGRNSEFIKRAAFALIAGLTVHDRTAADVRFVRLLPIIERGAADDRNYVRKAVSWALRQIGKRNIVLNGAAVVVAQRLARAPDASSRWVGKDALRELSSPAVQKRLADRYTG
ncbi:MAG: DNA alkylation repair protein [Vicinamibacterales bacterium]